jgi:hypothetical protein
MRERVCKDLQYPLFHRVQFVVVVANIDSISERQVRDNAFANEPVCQVGGQTHFQVEFRVLV